MQEIEAKILEIDVVAIRDKLLTLGAQRVFDGPVDSVFLRDESGRKLRLRRMWERNFVTHKIPLPSESAKSNDEFETDISSIEEMETLLLRMGFTAYARSTKYRESYELAGTRYEIDSISGVPPYVEIEAESEEGLRAAVGRLGYSMSETVAMGEGEVKRHYGLLV